jgi:hypothetical protein
MQKYLLIIGLLFLDSLNAAQAHSSAIATYEFKQGKNSEWSLTINVPLGGLHLALLQHYDEDDLWTKPGVYNVELVNDYLQQHSKVVANKTTSLRLKAISSKLDDHQSQFIFAITNMPPSLQKLSFEVDAMSENEGHINIARVTTQSSKQRVILQYANDYRSDLALQ